MDETLDSISQNFQLEKTPRAPFLVDGSLHYIFKNFTVTEFKHEVFPKNLTRLQIDGLLQHSQNKA